MYNVSIFFSKLLLHFLQKRTKETDCETVDEAIYFYHKKLTNI